ncbi:MAG: signal peptide peptidase SppA [Alphaproteobacteria bacterium]
MSLGPDALIDRQKLKRLLSLWRTMAIIAVAALIVVLFGHFDGLKRRQHIARLTVSGIILEDRVRDEALDDIAGDDSVKALIVRVDSPGGTVVGGEALFKNLRSVAAEKPVVAVMGTTATSAGYMVALGADHIFAREGSITGSIGVILQTTDISGLLAKLGVSTEAIKSSPLKAVPSPLEPLTPEGREATRALIMDMYDMFVSLVAERRNLAREEAVGLADGRIFTGRQAVANKLIDAIGGEGEALVWLEAEHGISRSLPVRDVQLHYEADFIDAAISTIAGKTKLSERLTLDGLISLWHLDLGRP